MSLNEFKRGQIFGGYCREEKHPREEFFVEEIFRL